MIDVDDLEHGIAFWGAVLGAAEEPIAPQSRQIYRRLLLPDSEVRILLQATADRKVAKERMHLDIETDDVEAELQRLVALGASPWDHQHERGYDFWALRDPWGNEFCILQTEFPHLLIARPPWDQGAAALPQPVEDSLTDASTGVDQEPRSLRPITMSKPTDMSDKSREQRERAARRMASLARARTRIHSARVAAGPDIASPPEPPRKRRHLAYAILSAVLAFTLLCSGILWPDELSSTGTRIASAVIGFVFALTLAGCAKWQFRKYARRPPAEQE
ncbi:VOC family protein [Nocardia sp. NPDC057668]|uniref:VOC family protein n=1 Tax=Nocardia sp. NPDC057668 TaxID=3346202 RepID=UPI0036709E97